MKIKITESQFKKIKQLTENYLDLNDKYEEKVSVRFFHMFGPLTFNGKKIEDVYNLEMKLYFNIDMDVRSFGIDEIKVVNVKGYETIDCEYLTEDETEGTFELKLNWDKLEINHEKNSDSHIGLDNELDVYLMNDNTGNIVVQKMEIKAYDF